MDQGIGKTRQRVQYNNGMHRIVRVLNFKKKRCQFGSEEKISLLHRLRFLI